MSTGTAMRTLPQSEEAEEFLLSCCLLDGADVVTRCIEAGIKPGSFYDQKHAIVYECVLDLYNRQAPIDVSVVAEELKTSRQLDAVGGYAFLTQVSSRIPTTAMATYYIESVRALAVRRETIRRGNQIVEDAYAFTGNDVDALVAASREKLAAIAETTSRTKAKVGAGEMPWGEILAFKPGIDPDCLLGTRYLGRTGALVIVAPSGVGKSVLSMDLSACAALGRPFFGLKIAQPLRVLYVQAEDDIGDVAEGAQGFIRYHGLGATEIDQLKQRLRVLRWNDAAGPAFLSRLRKEHAAWPFDLVVINPLFSFCGCSVSDQREMSSFLRNGLNPILNDTRAAAVVVHHVNKPIADPKSRPGDSNTELQYAGSGSAELTNWARAIIALQAVTAAEGIFRMRFAKRGKRAGIVDESGRPTTSVMIEHAAEGLCWVPSSYAIGAKGEGGKFKPRFDLTRACEVFDPSLPWSDNEQAIAIDQDMSRKQVGRYRKNIMDTAA